MGAGTGQGVNRDIFRAWCHSSCGVPGLESRRDRARHNGRRTPSRRGDVEARRLSSSAAFTTRVARGLAGLGPDRRRCRTRARSERPVARHPGGTWRHRPVEAMVSPHHPARRWSSEGAPPGRRAHARRPWCRRMGPIGREARAGWGRGRGRSCRTGAERGRNRPRPGARLAGRPLSCTATRCENRRGRRVSTQPQR